MPVGFAIAGAAVAGAVIEGNAAKSAAKTQAQAAGAASDVQRQMFDISTADQMPYMQAGYGANASLSRLLGIQPQDADGNPINAAASDNTGLPTGYLSQTFGPDQFKAGMDPGYQWRLQQGAQGVMNSAAAGSGSLSGPALKALIDYNQGAASQEYGAAFDRFQTQQGNIYQRLMGISTLGQNAAARVGNQAIQTGSNIGANITGAGNAQAAGQIGAANAYSSGLNNLGSLAYLYAGGVKP